MLYKNKCFFFIRESVSSFYMFSHKKENFKRQTNNLKIFQLNISMFHFGLLYIQVFEAFKAFFSAKKLVSVKVNLQKTCNFKNQM